MSGEDGEGRGEKGEGGRGEAAEEASAGKRRDRFIKVMADYFNIPMGVRAPFVVSCQFNNPRPADPFLAGARHYFETGCSLRFLPRSTRRRRMARNVGCAIGRDFAPRNPTLRSSVRLRISSANALSARDMDRRYVNIEAGETEKEPRAPFIRA